MRIGLIIQLHGSPDSGLPPPTWERVKGFASTAEDVGFDSLVFEDALIYREADTTRGCWESMAIAAGLAAVTSRIEFGQSVVNAPYRSPALTAKIAETIDEISGGRYICGIGAGNTEDYDYQAFGFPSDHRYSRFAEAIQILHGLLKEGRVDFTGQYHSAEDSELDLRGPRTQGPPIVVAAGYRGRASVSASLDPFRPPDMLPPIRSPTAVVPPWRWHARPSTSSSRLRSERPV